MTDVGVAVDKKKTSPTTEAPEEEPLPNITQELAESLTDDVRSPPTSYPLTGLRSFLPADSALWRNYSKGRTTHRS